MKKNILTCVFLAALLFFMPFAGFAYADNNSISSSEISNNEESINNETVIYFTNDIHGNITNVNKQNGMSYATIKALKNKEESLGNIVYSVDAGDHVSGCSYCNTDFGESISKIMNECDYSVCVPGNHELDYGSDYFFDYINTKYPKTYKYYACNFYYGSDTEYKSNILEPYKIVDGKNGEKIAFIGIMTPNTIASTAPGYYKDSDGNWIYYIANNTQPDLEHNIYSCVDKAINSARDDGATKFIAVGHLGDDSVAVKSQCDAETVIKNTHGLDAFIDGHSHTIHEGDHVIDASGKDVIRLQAASGLDANNEEETQGINRIGEIRFDSSGNMTYKILKANNGSYDQVKPDSKVMQMEKELIKNVDSYLSSKVCTNNIDFPASKSIQRVQCSNLSDICTDSIYYYTNTMKDDKGNINSCDAAILNGGSIRNELVRGTVTNSDLMNLTPYSNKLNLVEVSGQNILDALEFGARESPEQNAGLLHTAGLTYYIDNTIESTVQVENDIWAGPPTGQYRVNGVKIYNNKNNNYEDLDLDKKYKLAAYNYLIPNQGDGYAMFNGAKVISNYTSESQYYLAYNNYMSDFLKNSNEELPQISSVNSPLVQNFSYNNLKIDYENLEGANRIIFGKYTPEPDPKPDQSSDTSDASIITTQQNSDGTDNNEIEAKGASTSDYNVTILMVLITTAIISISALYSSRKVLNKKLDTE